jgi:hypothetical protein
MDRWDALREAKRCFAKGDFEGAMKTGVVCRKKRWIGGKDGYEVIDYEIKAALIEALNSVEKRAAIETGQKVDRADINLRGSMAEHAAVLQKAFTLDELEVIEARPSPTKHIHKTATVIPPQRPWTRLAANESRTRQAMGEPVAELSRENRQGSTASPLPRARRGVGGTDR